MNAIVNPDEVRKAVVDSLSNPSEDIARHVLSMAGANPNQIEKSITTGTGLVAYDLQAPAKNLTKVAVIEAKLDGLDRLMTRETDEIKHTLRALEPHGMAATGPERRGRRVSPG